MYVLFSLKYEICQQNSGVTESLFGVCVPKVGGGCVGGGGVGGGQTFIWGRMHNQKLNGGGGGGHWGAQGVNGGGHVSPPGLPYLRHCNRNVLKSIMSGSIDLFDGLNKLLLENTYI